ncbi:hypothetical protein CRG98_019330 [Punica granatum]|uniref:Uncharacterized protein n=1 Tax=Punica granatum TaxID=22663 RepID=A0A2I0JVH0_PUNGR|nr:hypothetical protein CRG98_019330 [Punica granatum]
MEEAEAKRLHEMYDRHFEAFGKAYQELLSTPYDDSGVVLDREVLDRIGFMIGKQALLVRTFSTSKIARPNTGFCLVASLHQKGELRATTLENCIQRIFNLLRGFFWNVHRSLYIVGPILARIFYESIKELKDCTIELLECTVACGTYGPANGWDGFPDLAIKVFNAYESFINNPKMSPAEIGIAILQVANDVEGALSEMEKKAESSTGKSNEEEGSTRNSLIEEKTVRAMAIRVVSSTVPVMKEMTCAVRIWKGTDLPGLIMVMEHLLMSSVGMKVCIDEIGTCLCPLREVRILKALICMRTSVNYITCRLQPSKHGLTEFVQKLFMLRTSMGELEDALINLFIRPSRSC